mgnify:CR=1 FL=1
MAKKNKKHLFEFTVNKEETVKESHSEKNDKGETITTEKEVTKQVPVYFSIKKPTRRLYDEADLFYSVKLSEGIKAGLLTRTLLEKRFENDGGIFSEGDKDRYFELYRLVFEKENELQQIALNLKNLKEEDKNEKIAEVYTELTMLRRDLQEYETLYSSLFEQTAENRAKNSTVMWWVLFLSQYKMSEGEDYKSVFDGSNYDARIESYDLYEEADDDFWVEAIKKLVYFVSFWYSGNGQTEEDFKEAEKFYDQGDEEGEEGEEGEDAENEGENKEKQPKKRAPKKRKPRKKKTDEEPAKTEEPEEKPEEKPEETEESKQDE